MTKKGLKTAASRVIQLACVC